jgi:selenium-binding protein 1
MTVVDVDSQSSGYGKVVGQVEMPRAGDELHHFGWNACSSALCPYAPHPHVERRYLVVPGLRSSRIYILDTKPNPRQPEVVKVIEPEEVFGRARYSRLHTIHCGPEGIYVSALGAPDGGGPGGVFLLDHSSFDVLGQWEVDRGPQNLAYDFWWHLTQDTMITSEWGTPNMIESGLQPDLLLGGQYGRRIHVWDLRRRRHLKALDLGEEQQLVLELRAAHDPTKLYGFVGVVVSLKNLSSSIWLWYQDNGDWTVKKVIEIPAEPADPEQLPPLLKGFKAVPPLVTDINLSLDDRTLYVSCWGTGEMRQYDVSDPFNPKLTGAIHLGGIVRRTPHPARPAEPLNGGPQMVEVSRDGRRVYFTNSLYHSWDEQFYPDGVRGWMARLDVRPGDGLAVSQDFFVEFDGFRPHQVRLEGGDCSSDSYCYP